MVRAAAPAGHSLEKAASQPEPLDSAVRAGEAQQRMEPQGAAELPCSAKWVSCCAAGDRVGLKKRSTCCGRLSGEQALLAIMSRGWWAGTCDHTDTQDVWCESPKAFAREKSGKKSCSSIWRTHAAPSAPMPVEMQSTAVTAAAAHPVYGRPGLPLRALTRRLLRRSGWGTEGGCWAPQQPQPSSADMRAVSSHRAPRPVMFWQHQTTAFP